MSALTYEVKDRQSPVAAWLGATFPQYKEIQSEFRVAAGVQQVLMPAGVVPGTQGAAIDFWLRMLVDPLPSIALPLVGLLSGRAPCLRAGRELLRELAAGESPRKTANGAVELRMRPAGFADRGDEWWARVCYALALLVELYRAVSVEHSRLMRLDESSCAADLLALANEVEVADLVAMRDLAVERLLPGLPAGPVTTGMTFDGSADLAGDADLIAGGMLVDFKAGQGGKPRADGTRAASLARTDLDQLLGYALLDYSDRYGLHTVGVYAVRFGYLAAWPLAELGQRMAGRPVDLAALRAEFAGVLRDQLPPYQSRRGW
ncbi:hypothetical protein O7623_22905 [Solwaraspora sp. WMMD791]|uniref:hypothetical protein n=1 Tax=Solwaraspora sp. WMMD791 TaxID=3016086 RepID=UPI00249CC774|nr:hypothetical protein [Solwaraspora sp. WMMD791]WFE26177.1 hypothetical protein O7623_22905 [Solwaraspora sp. WMMD791]